MSSVTITDNTPEALAAMKAAKARGLEICGGMAESYAKKYLTEQHAVDTGNLRNSINHFLKNDEEYIGTSVHYAPYVEFGTIKMKARPYLRPAAEGHAREYKFILENELRKG